MKQILRNKDGGTRLVRYKKSFFHAIDGFVYTVKYEHNMIIILIAAFMTIITGMLLKIKTSEWLFCILIIGLIMAVEFINSSLEAVVDLASPKLHPLAKIAKDTASSATLILCFVALIGAIIIFVPKILSIL